MYRILIIEDDPSVQDVLGQLLVRDGLEVLSAGDGAGGVRLAIAENPDLILLDVNLPDMDGFEVCTRLKAEPRTRHIPVVILTAEAREVGQRVRGLESGADDYLFKPISGKVLVARILSILKVANKPVK